MIYAYLKCASEADWTSLYEAHLANLQGVEVDTLGTIYHDTGATQTVNGVTSPVMQAVDGWHVNVVMRGDDFPEALHAYCVNPLAPKRVFFGAYTLAMPEQLVDAGETRMITRGIGADIDEATLVAIETDIVRAKLAAEPERRALHEATLAVLAHREAMAAEEPVAVEAVGLGHGQIEVAELDAVQAATDRLSELRAARDALK